MHLLFTDAAHWGWTLAILVRVTAHAEKALGLWIYRVNVRALGDGIAKPDRVPQGITVRVLTEAELLEAAKDEDLELSPDFIRSALARGDLCCGAYEGDRLVGYTWRAPARAPFRDHVWIRISEPLHYVYKSYTKESHRGRGIHIALTRLADRYMLEKGLPAEVGFIDISNLPSLRAARSLGRHKVGWVGYLRLFGRCFTFRTPGVRATGTAFYEPQASQPAAVLEPGLTKVAA
jgi:GNAT superfamily N-acetyltransferase